MSNYSKSTRLYQAKLGSQRPTENESSQPPSQGDQLDQLDQPKDQQKIEDLIKDQPASMANIASLAKNETQGWQIASLANSASPADIAIPAIAKGVESLAIFASLKPTQGFLKLPNWILDSLPALVDGSEQIVYIHLYRLSHGFGKDKCLVSLDKLAERTGFSKRTVQTILHGLENKSLITKIGHSFGKGVPQGTIFRVAIFASPAESTSLANDASLAKPATIKDLKNKKKYYKEIILQLKQSHVGSVYSISDLVEDVKRTCLRDGEEFDHQIFNDLI